MFDRPVRHRRAQRIDFAAVAGLLAATGPAVVQPDRATLRGFRRLVADLGCDLYVATADSDIVGLVHVSYARRLAAPPGARMELLVVAPHARGRRIGRGLVELAAQRARQRGCRVLECAAAAATAQAFLQHIGWETRGARFEFDLDGAAQ
jgi:ribosomal-protein-alanine N-acetyltransferase